MLFEYNHFLERAHKSRMPNRSPKSVLTPTPSAPQATHVFSRAFGLKSGPSCRFVRASVAGPNLAKPSPDPASWTLNDLGRSRSILPDRVGAYRPPPKETHRSEGSNTTCF